MKKYTSPANEFLLHACRQTDIHPDIYPPIDERYSPIISPICEPNEQTIFSKRQNSRIIKGNESVLNIINKL